MSLALVTLAIAQERSAEDKLADAREALNSGELSNAGELFELVRIQSASANAKATEAEALLGLLEIHYRQVKKDPARQTTAEAEADRVRAIGSPGQVQSAINLWGLILLHSGKLQAGLEQFERLNFDEVDPTDRYVYHFNKGKAYERNKQPYKAIREYLRALEQKPDFDPALNAAFSLLDFDAFHYVADHVLTGFPAFSSYYSEGRGRAAADICRAVAQGNGDVTKCVARARATVPATDRPELDAFELEMKAKPGAFSDLCAPQNAQRALQDLCIQIESGGTRSTSVPLPSAHARQRYLWKLSVPVMARPPFEFAIENAPSWVKIDPKDAVLSGVPPAPNESGSRFRLVVTDADKNELRFPLLLRTDNPASQILDASSHSFNVVVPAWSGSDHALSVAAAALGAAAEPGPDQAKSRLSTNTRLNAYTLAMSAYPANYKAGLGAVTALVNSSGLTAADRKRFTFIVAGYALQGRPAELTDENLKAAPQFLTLLGEVLQDYTKCGSGRDSADPLTFWKAGADMVPLNSPLTLQTRRYLADCYSHVPGGSTLRAQYEESVAASTKDRYLRLTRYHVSAMYYPGAWLKSSVQAGLLQAMDSPHNWRQGVQGYVRRLGYSEAARVVRQGLALGIDSTLKQDPHYIPSPPARWQRRLAFAAKQTLLSRGDRLNWEFAWWRWGSAFGSEAISNSWRPSGPGLGNRNGSSWAARGAYVLGGDTASNILREFLPKGGLWGALLRPFL